MSYEFQSMLYRTPRAMCDAVAEMWLCADGKNSRTDMLKALAQCTDEQLADECILAWKLDEQVYFDSESPTWMEQREVEHSDIVKAFADLRETFDSRFPQ